MTYCIAVFRSRSQAIDCKEKLLKSGINAELISTPSSLSIGCGLSVKFAAAAYGRVKSLITRAGYSAFYGYMNLRN